MQTVHVVGRQNHGKTTLVVELIAEFRRRGLRVGTFKHSAHAHELDTPGKDSHRHRQAGADPSAIITAQLIATFQPRRDDLDPYESLLSLYGECDLVIVEGDRDRTGIKVEVYRASLGTAPLAAERSDILAVISDDPVPIDLPVWPRSTMDRLTRQVIALTLQ